MQKREWYTPVVAIIFVGITMTPADGKTELYGAEHQNCAGSTQQTVECLSKYTRSWDKRLNAAYQELLKGNPQAQQLRTTQRLWLKFRDANCRYYGLGEGTIVKIRAAACLRYMTSQRAQELEELLEGG